MPSRSKPALVRWSTMRLHRMREEATPNTVLPGRFFPVVADWFFMNVERCEVANIYRETLRKVIKPPVMTLARPPISSQMDLIVGDPVKNREKSELMESVARLAKTSRTMPTTTNAMPRGLFHSFVLVEASMRSRLKCSRAGACQPWRVALHPGWVSGQPNSDFGERMSSRVPRRANL